MVAVDVGVILVDVDVDVVVVDELVSDEWKTNNKSCDLLLVFCSQQHPQPPQPQ